MEGRRERGLTGKGGPCSPGQEEEEGHQIEQEDLVVPEPHTVVHPGTVVVKPAINSERDREVSCFRLPVHLATQCWQAAQCLERRGLLTRQVEQNESLLNSPRSHSSAMVWGERE